MFQPCRCEYRTCARKSCLSNPIAPRANHMAQQDFRGMLSSSRIFLHEAIASMRLKGAPVTACNIGVATSSALHSSQRSASGFPRWEVLIQRPDASPETLNAVQVACIDDQGRACQSWYTAFAKPCSCATPDDSPPHCLGLKLRRRATVALPAAIACDGNALPASAHGWHMVVPR